MFTAMMVETYSQCVPWKWAVDDLPSLFFLVVRISFRRKWTLHPSPIHD